MRKNTVIIIGNGFDLCAGLDTSYVDFIKSDEFKKIIDKGNKLAIALFEKYNKDKWSDIEIYLKEYIKSETELEIGEFENNYKDLKLALRDYLRRLNYNSAIIKESVQKLINEKILRIGDEDIANRSTTILDFNYSGWLRDYIWKERMKSFIIPEVEYKFVHGYLFDSDIEKLIFGIDEDSNVPTKYSFLLKAYGETYRDEVIKNTLLEADEIIIFGHSLGETDKMYFGDFFEALSNKSKTVNNIVIYFHDSKSKNELIARLIEMTKYKYSKLSNVIKWESVYTHEFKGDMNFKMVKL